MYYIAFLFLISFATSQFAEKTEVYSEVRSFGALPSEVKETIKICSFTKFVIDLPTTWWWYPTPNKWIISKIIGPDSVKCDMEQDMCPLRDDPMVKTAKESSAPPAAAKMSTENTQDKMLYPYYYPRQQFSCKSQSPGKALIKLSFVALGVAKPCLVYKVHLIVKEKDC